MIINNIANINFGGGGGSDIKVQDMKIVTQDVNSSGLYDFQPDEGYDAMKVLRANLNIPTTPVQTIDLKIGIKISNSTFSAMPFTLICDSGVTDMKNLFSNCENLTTLDVSNFDTSNVTTMNSLFMSCKNLTTLDVSNFNTINVTNMAFMFSSCKSLTTLDFSNFNTSKVTNMDTMFARCENLTTLDLSNFNTSKVTNMSNMFSNCRSLITLDLSNFDTSKINSVYNIYDMFSNCNSLTTVKVTNCDESTKNKILTRLQADMSSYTWTLGDDGIIRRSEKTA